MTLSSDDLLSKACGQLRPISLIAALNDNQKISKFVINKPYTIIGRHAACDVSLPHAGLSKQHVYLQVLDGRLFCVDQGSRTGLFWKDKPRLYGWLDAGEWIKVGPHRITLQQPVGADTCRSKDARNTAPFLMKYKSHPKTAAQLVLNDRLTLPLQSQMTVIGKSKYCNLELEEEDISRVHASIVKTSDGKYWLIDLLSRIGVKLNGKRCHSAQLNHNDIIQIGGYSILFNDVPILSIRQTIVEPNSTLLTTPVALVSNISQLTESSQQEEPAPALLAINSSQPEYQSIDEIMLDALTTDVSVPAESIARAELEVAGLSEGINQPTEPTITEESATLTLADIKTDIPNVPVTSAMAMEETPSLELAAIPPEIEQQNSETALPGDELPLYPRVPEVRQIIEDNLSDEPLPSAQVAHDLQHFKPTSTEMGEAIPLATPSSQMLGLKHDEELASAALVAASIPSINAELPKVVTENEAPKGASQPHEPVPVELSIPLVDNDRPLLDSKPEEALTPVDNFSETDQLAEAMPITAPASEATPPSKTAHQPQSEVHRAGQHLVLHHSSTVPRAIVVRERHTSALTASISKQPDKSQLVVKQASLVKPKPSAFMPAHIKVTRPPAQQHIQLSNNVTFDELGLMGGLMQCMKQMQQEMMSQMRMNMEMMAEFMGNLQKQQADMIRQELTQLGNLNKELLELRQSLLTASPPVNGQTTREHALPSTTPIENARKAPAKLQGSTDNKPQPRKNQAQPTKPGKHESAAPQQSHVWISKRIALLEQERLSRWEKMKSAVMGK